MIATYMALWLYIRKKFKTEAKATYPRQLMHDSCRTRKSKSNTVYLLHYRAISSHSALL